MDQENSSQDINQNLRKQIKDLEKQLSQKQQKVTSLNVELEELKAQQGGQNIQVQQTQIQQNVLQSLKAKIEHQKEESLRQIQDNQKLLQKFKSFLQKVKHQNQLQKKKFLQQETQQNEQTRKIEKSVKEFMEYIEHQFELSNKEKNNDEEEQPQELDKKLLIKMKQLSKYLKKQKENMRLVFKPYDIKNEINLNGSIAQYFQFIKEIQNKGNIVEEFKTNKIGEDKEKVDKNIKKIRKELDDIFFDEQKDNNKTDLQNIKKSAQESKLFQFSNDHNKYLELYNCLFQIKKALNKNLHYINDKQKFRQIEKSFDQIEELIGDIIDDNSSKFQNYEYQGNYLFTFLYKKQIDELQIQLKEYEERIKQLEQQLDKKDQNLQDLDLQKNNLVTQNESLKQSNENYINKNQNLNDQLLMLQNQTNIINMVQQTEIEINQSILNLKNEYKNQQRHYNQNFKSIIEDKDEKIKDFQNTIKQMSEKITALEKTIWQIQREKPVQQSIIHSINDISTNSIEQEKIDKKIMQDQKNLELLEDRKKELKKLTKNYLQLQKKLEYQQAQFDSQQTFEQQQHQKQIQIMEQNMKKQKDDYQNRLTKQYQKYYESLNDNKIQKKQNILTAFISIVLFVSMYLYYNYHTKQFYVKNFLLNFLVQVNLICNKKLYIYKYESR